VWNVAHVHPNHEGQVARLLALQGIEIYCPRFAAPKGTRPGSVRDGRPRWVFPGYIFFRVPEGFARWDLVQWASGVRRVLSDDGKPSPVSDAVVARLRTRLAQPAGRRPTFRRGQPLVIERGPLAMVDAIFDRELNKSERVQVLVHLLGRPMTVVVDAAILRPAS
jgi:transcription antitermination factor NusG